MNHLELVVQHADSDQPWQWRLVGDRPLEVQHQPRNLGRWGRDEPGTRDAGNASDMDGATPEPARRVFLAAYPAQQELMQFTDERRCDAAVGRLSQPVLQRMDVVQDFTRIGCADVVCAALFECQQLPEGCDRALDLAGRHCFTPHEWSDQKLGIWQERPDPIQGPEQMSCFFE